MTERIEATTTRTGGREATRRFVVALAFLLGVASAVGAAAAGEEPRVEVAEQSGTYRLSATFTVPQPATTVFEVLTAYEQIPQIMPDVRTSTVLEKNADGAVVEQEAIAKFMLFSRRIHLVLDVHQDAHTIHFRDRCGQSFDLYDGTWTIGEQDGRTTVRYELTARPSFTVPEFVLKRLLKRDSVEMLDRLKAAIASQ
jgi:uncharacterized protein YndB with AHSA1/START domain